VVYLRFAARLAPALGVALALGSALSLPAQVVAPTSEAIRGDAFAPAIAPLFQDWCASCHEGSEPDGGLDLTAWSADEPAAELLLKLRRIRDRVRSGEMPPPDADPIDAEDRRALVGWADGALREWAPKVPSPPGRTTIRRLSRGELRNTLRDLLGVESSAVQQLPADDLGYGFDNIGDAVTFSLLHLEKFQAVAADVAQQVAHPDPERRVVVRVEGEDLDFEGANARAAADSLVVFSRGAPSTVVRLARGGAYRFQLRASGDQAGDEPPFAEIVVDGVQLARFAVASNRRDPQLHTATLQLSAGRHKVQVRFPNDFYRATGDVREDRNLHIDWIELVGPEEPWQPPAGARWLHELAGGRGDAKRRARPMVAELLRRAWRRPPSSGDVTRLTALVGEVAEAEGSLGAGLQAAVEAALLSPQFLFRVEPAVRGSGARVRSLDGHALATRLSYFLWGSMPDEPLRQRAARGGLATEEQVRAEVQRMIRDPRAEALATHFAAQWLELRSLDEAQPDPERFGVDRALLAAFARETELLFLDVLRRELPARSLLGAEQTFVNGALAAHYGVDGVEGDEFVAVAVPPRRRVGVLGHGSVLTVTSNPTRTSPVKRGKWVLENLLGAPPPPPPPGADSFGDESQAVNSAASLREQMAQHRANPACASCHLRMDAMGLALENFDAVGRFRTRDEGGAVDARGQLPDGRSIDGVVALRDVLLEGRHFERTLLRKLFVYAVGRNPSASDEIALEAILLGLPEAATLTRMIEEIAAMDAFRATGGPHQEQPR